MISRFQKWWITLNARERRVLSLGTLFVVLAVVIFGDIDPVWRLRANLLEDVPRLRQQQLEMQALADEARRLRGVQMTSPEANSLETLVTSALTERGLSPHALVAMGVSEIQVTLKAVDVASCLHWMEQMNREARLTIQSARLVRGGDLLDAQVTLRRAPRS